MYSERNGPSAGLRPLIRTPNGTGAGSERGPLRSTSLQGRRRHCQHGDAGARRWRPGARNYGAILSAFKTPVHLMRQDSLMLDGRPTFAVGYDRSFSSTEEVDDFLANSEEREVVETVYPFLWCLLGGAVYKRKLVLRQGDLQRAARPATASMRSAIVSFLITPPQSHENSCRSFLLSSKNRCASPTLSLARPASLRIGSAAAAANADSG